MTVLASTSGEGPTNIYVAMKSCVSSGSPVLFLHRCTYLLTSFVKLVTVIRPKISKSVAPLVFTLSRLMRSEDKHYIARTHSLITLTAPCLHTRAHTHTRTHAHARTHTHTHTHTTHTLQVHNTAKTVAFAFGSIDKQ